jgi:hypothetical protein
MRPLRSIIVPRFSAAGACWQNNRRTARGGVGQNARYDECFEIFEALLGDSAVHSILAKHNEACDLTGCHTRCDGWKFSRGHAEELRTGGVRVSIIRDEESIALLRTGQDIEILDLQAGSEAAGEEEFLVRHAGGGDEGGLRGIATIKVARRRRRWRGTNARGLLALYDGIG